MIRLILTLGIIAVIAVAVVWAAGTPQAEVAADRAREHIEDALGRERVQLARLDRRLGQAEGAWQRQVFAKHRLAVLAENAAAKGQQARADRYARQSADCAVRQAQIRERLDQAHELMTVLRERVEELEIIRDYAGTTAGDLPADSGDIAGEVEREILGIEAEIRAWSEMAAGGSGGPAKGQAEGAAETADVPPRPPTGCSGRD